MRVVRLLVAACLPMLAWAGRPSVPRTPNLLALERNGNASAVLGFGKLEDRTTIEFAVEGEIEAIDDLLVGLIVPAAKVREVEAGTDETLYDEDGILLCTGDNCRGSGESNGTALGNIGLTARTLWPRGKSDARFAAGVGLTLWLPTATEDASASELAGLGLATHPLDPGRFAVDRFTIRPTGALGYAGRLFLAQLELGCDIPISLGSDDERSRFPLFDPDNDGDDDVLLLTAAALGVADRPVALYAEIGALHHLGQGDMAEPVQTTLAFGVRSYGTRLVLGLALVLPVNGAAKNTIDAGIRLTGGARF